MAVNPQGTTVAVPFFSCSSDQTNLFSVQPGVPMLNALQMASAFLETARDAVYRAAESSEDNSGHAAGYLVTMAKSVVDSVVQSIEFPHGEEGKQPKSEMSVESFDSDSCGLAFNTIASLASRCLCEVGGKSSHDMLWSIQSISENYANGLGCPWSAQ